LDSADVAGCVQSWGCGYTQPKFTFKRLKIDFGMFGTSQLKLIFSSKILSNLKQRFVVFYSKLVFCAQVYCSTAFDVNITKHKPFILNSLLTKINSTKSIESKYIFATVKSNRHLTLLL